jgi:hypothetical protein
MQIELFDARKEGRSRIGALHDRARERKKRGANQRAADRAGGRNDGDGGRKRHDQSDREQQRHEHEAIDGARFGAGPPIMEHHDLQRRRRAQKASHRLGHEIGLAP